MSFYVDLNAWWVGYFRGTTHHYVCLAPTLVMRWPRRESLARPFRAERPRTCFWSGCYRHPEHSTNYCMTHLRASVEDERSPPLRAVPNYDPANMEWREY